MRLKRFLLSAGVLFAILAIPGVSTPKTDATYSLLQDSLGEHQCLALNVYWEARSEPVLGQQAVAAVTMNRVQNRAFPDNICQVVKQGGESRNRCQFSWWCDGKSDKPKDRDAWIAAQNIAWAAIHQVQDDPTEGALFYHASYVKPNWARSMTKTTRIGSHIFFIDPAMTFDSEITPNASPEAAPKDQGYLAMLF